MILSVDDNLEAVLPITEISSDEKNNFSEIFKVGEYIDGKIISLSNSDGRIVLSRLEIFREKSLEILKK